MFVKITSSEHSKGERREPAWRSKVLPSKAQTSWPGSKAQGRESRPPCTLLRAVWARRGLRRSARRVPRRGSRDVGPRGPAGKAGHPTSGPSSRPGVQVFPPGQPGVPASCSGPESGESASLIGLEHKRMRALPETRSLIGFETNSRTRNKEAFRHWAIV